MQDSPIFDYIDAPSQILFWEADELAPIIVAAAIGILTDSLTYLLIPMYFFHKYFVYFKNQHMPGYLHHLMYRMGLLPLNKRFNNGAITTYHV